jgi:hypothetical protein
MYRRTYTYKNIHNISVDCSHESNCCCSGVSMLYVKFYSCKYIAMRVYASARQLSRYSQIKYIQIFLNIPRNFKGCSQILRAFACTPQMYWNFALMAHSTCKFEVWTWSKFRKLRRLNSENRDKVVLAEKLLIETNRKTRSQAL